MKTHDDVRKTTRKSENFDGRLPINKGNKVSCSKGSDHSLNRISKPAFKKGNDKNRWTSNNDQNFNRENTRTQNFKPRFNKSFRQQDTNFQRWNNETTSNKTYSQARHTRFDIEDENESKISVGDVNEVDPGIKVVRRKSKTDLKNGHKGSSKSPQAQDTTKSTNKKKPKKSRKKRVAEDIPNFEDPKAKKKFFYRTLLVGGLPSTVEKAPLLKIFSKYGKISHVVLKSPKSSESEMPLTESFVVFQKRQEAIKALELNGMEYEEHCLQVQICDGLKYDQNKAIVVTNLPADTSEDDLWTVFQSCGPIMNVHLSRNKKKEVTGTGYVNFESLSSVELTLKMDNVTVKNQVVKIKKQKSHKAVKKCSQESDTEIPKSKFQKTAESDKSQRIKLQAKKQKLKKTKELTQKTKKIVSKN